MTGACFIVVLNRRGMRVNTTTNLQTYDDYDDDTIVMGRDGTDGREGTDGQQKCPSIFFILCRYIDNVYVYLHTK